MNRVSFLTLCAACLLSVSATQPSPPQTPPNSSKPQLWQDDFNPQTRDERVDTDNATDEDVIIMEEDEDSENLPGNSENAPQ